jgi:hypothetical protein
MRKACSSESGDGLVSMPSRAVIEWRNISLEIIKQAMSKYMSVCSGMMHFTVKYDSSSKGVNLFPCGAVMIYCRDNTTLSLCIATICLLSRGSQVQVLPGSQICLVARGLYMQALSL